MLLLDSCLKFLVQVRLLHSLPTVGALDFGGFEDR